jgi:beta subunit of N-acylethanolamine-hydrolyzing acid amidase
MTAPLNGCGRDGLMGRRNDGDRPPVFRIDLSLPPLSRYVALAEQYQSKLRGLMQLFNGLLEDLGIPPSLFSTVQRMARLFLRRVHSYEETLELKGISRVTHVPMYLLVSFNVLLDLLMGCTSGAARSLEKYQDFHRSKMLHFRTLDWDMDPLREVIVQLEFVRSASRSPEKVLARSLTYVGFVGVLTGVRRGLSMSLNFRPQHNANSRMDHVRFYFHNLLVLLGQRQSISSLLRSCLFTDGQGPFERPISLDSLSQTIPTKASTAAYLIFSDGQSTITIEKDKVTGKIKRSHSFIVITNHDLDSTSKIGSAQRSNATSSLQGLIAESVDRRACIVEKWRTKAQKEQSRRKRTAEKFQNLGGSNTATVGTVTSRRGAPVEITLHPSSKEAGQAISEPFISNRTEDAVYVTLSELRKWVTAWPTTNECTHFSAILDPTEGQVVWARRYLTPITTPPSLQTRSSFLTDSTEPLWD